MRVLSLSKYSGYSLLELLITMAVSAILAGTAVPSLANFIARQSLLAEAQSVHRLLASARDFSINNNEFVSFCGVTKNGQCTQSGIHAYAVFIDENYNHVIDPEDIVLSFEQTTFPSKSNSIVPNRKHFTFKPDGYAKLPGSVAFCKKMGSEMEGRRLITNRSGRVYLKRLNKTGLEKYC